MRAGSAAAPSCAPAAGRLHVAIIMDGNGRWATTRGLPRLAGHERGVEAVRRTVRAAARTEIGTLTLYAFSADNWHRPAREVAGLMALFDGFLRADAEDCRREGIRVSIVGRRDRLGPPLRAGVTQIEAVTRCGTGLHVRIAVDYSAREAIWQAVCRLPPEGYSSRDAFAAAVRSGRGEPVDVPDVDLLIRTGGEQRLSDFLLWECAYAELFFTTTPWPDFDEPALQAALAAYAARDRRFGRLAGALS